MKHWQISSPITAHVEITDACNEKCRHCYNFDRQDDFPSCEITWGNLNNTIKELVDNKVLHVIITGGEPLLADEKANYLSSQCVANNISVSLNSNLVSVTRPMMFLLRKTGLNHCLTTLFSHKPEAHNYMAGADTFHDIIRGIRITQDEGIRVTVNAIISQHNINDIFETGRLLQDIGVKKFIANRVIPSQGNYESFRKEFWVDQEMQRKIIWDLKRVRDELGMEIQSCRTMAECFLSDPDGDDIPFAHRGCLARREIVLSPTGEAKACPHEGISYGNIHEMGIKGVWENMRAWRGMDFVPKVCQTCLRLSTCGGGCRLAALYFSGSLDGLDNMFTGDPVDPKPVTYNIPEENPVIRQEDGFRIKRIRGAFVEVIDD